MMAWWLCLTLAADPVAGPGTGSSRVDFDDHLVQGQRRGPGTVTLFERPRLVLPSLVRRSRSFRDRVIHTVYRE